LQQIVNTITMLMRYIVLLFLLSQVTFPANAQARSRIALAAEVASLFDASESLARGWRSSWPSIGGSSTPTLDPTTSYPSFPSSFTPLVDYNALMARLNKVVVEEGSYNTRGYCNLPKREETTIRVCRREFQKTFRTMRAMEQAGGNLSNPLFICVIHCLEKYPELEKDWARYRSH
jgi:hypothetical protein